MNSTTGNKIKTKKSVKTTDFSEKEIILNLDDKDYHDMISGDKLTGSIWLYPYEVRILRVERYE